MSSPHRGDDATRIVAADVHVTSPGRNFVTLSLRTRDCVSGLGDATVNGRELAAASYLRDHVVPLLVGRDAHAIEDTWQYLYRGAYWRRGPMAVVVNNPTKTIYVGAQMPQDRTGALVGKGDMRAQTVQVLANLKTVLVACNAGVEHLIQWTIYVVPGHDIMPAVEEAMRWLAGRSEPPLNTVVTVPGFPGSEALVSIEAIAVL